MTTLTDWYDPKVDGQPVRVGWYQRKWGTEFSRSYPDYWNGGKWQVGFGGQPFPSISASQYLPWRGLTEPNEEKPNGQE